MCWSRSLPPSRRRRLAPGIPLQARPRAERVGGGAGRHPGDRLPLAPARRRARQAWIKLGPLDELPRRARRAWPSTRIRSASPWDGATAKVPAGCGGSRPISSRSSRSTARISAARCAGSPQSRLFMCPCHGGVYYEDGSRASGPPPRGLYEYEYQVRGRPALGARRPAAHAVGAGVKLACARLAIRCGQQWIEDRAGLGRDRPARPGPSRPALDGELVVRLRQRDARAVHAPDRDRHLPRARLRALGGRGVPEPAVPELPGSRSAGTCAPCISGARTRWSR